MTNYIPRLCGPRLSLVSFAMALCFTLHPEVQAYAASAAVLTAEGNALYAEGKYNEALQAYEQAEREQPGTAEILFNKGNAYLQKGDAEKARQAYEAAALHTGDPALQARCQYNLGHAAFLAGEKKGPAATVEAVPLYERSVRHFQNALHLDPELAEAGENIEITRLRLRDLVDRIQAQEEMARQRREQQEAIRKELLETAAAQESQIQENASLKEQMARSPAEEFPREHEELSARQDEIREKTAEVSKKLSDFDRQPGASPTERKPSESSAQKQLQQAMAAQEAAKGNLDKRKLDAARQYQEKALQHMREAQSELDSSREDRQESPASGSESQTDEAKKEGARPSSLQEKDAAGRDGEEKPSPPAAPRPDPQAEQKPKEDAGKHTASSAAPGGEPKGDPLRAGAGRSALQEQAQDILQEEKENRLQLRRSRSSGAQPVDKDW